ncbi:MAG: hypothetical protein HN736_03605 [Anaerolineae bacterium]|jgi:hypothetical protein|nr:hypothetical protein [Anaerolineae bacterium]MBT3714737.1 hypothetical protein [Anaerolineae bacterium]MBT4309908.1 hypothetical protein [Anaerolineae bacterium]MBT4460059.1 hypothetical protein [Anaerolineae bacterium]MBT4843658.1 hypothetical protein [Anaerolineae bacterium]
MTKKVRRIFTLFLTMLFLGLSGCQGAIPVPEASTAEPTEEAAPAPKLASAVETVDENHCLDCHGDKQSLVDTAKPVVEVVSENEGAG